MTRHWRALAKIAWIVLLPAGFLLSSEGWCDEPLTAGDPIIVGSRVRLLATSIQGSIQGMVVEMDDKSMVLSTDRHRPVRVSRQAITRLDVSTGRRGRALKGMAIGGAIGAGTFAVIPREEYCADYDFGETCPTKAEMVGTGIVGGALWGALIGHFIKTDRWSPVPLEGAQVRLAPTRGRAGLGLALSVAW